MKTAIAAAVFATTLVASAAGAQEIKGIHIGMDKKAMPSMKNFTIAGVHPDSEPQARFDGKGKLVAFIFFFKPAYFDSVFGAVKSKFPELDCEEKLMQNAFGASFMQRRCTYGSMVITRYAADQTDLSAISMHDYSNLSRSADSEQERRRKDM